ncbi:SigE family RNA polymerase sigma factor [Stackebrandtia nassauensis]|uniref:RNA polymerase, sigma-24 subunit, ECF subfamily n=1 Tax=Stackebrandtia nassauensis (strain DSM 44728 / CIP 108903 / NRRL B-16338 / NBRC 102104 / LLR-40K-21) TaxID=446470 RepID=D3Q1G1_STANL|nr:SigE family RNA polymerase sigma factor [Stackebrandtia nassauensis]ADD45741.1 RNA polymerase, sigma-24 subunit, ECF subfamily [Stackebrandtia nassauensis DSM 44728]
MTRHRSDFEEFAIACTPALLRSAYLLTGDQHLAEDLVQSALARTHRAWKRLEHSGNAHAYTRKIMYHLQVSWWRRRKVAESFTETPVETAFADSTHDVDLRLSLRAALFQLAPRQRAVIVLRYFEDRSVTQTAEILGCAEGTVKTQAFRALNKLRSVLPDLVELTNGELA